MILVVDEAQDVPAVVTGKNPVVVSTVLEAVRMFSTHGHFDEVWFGLNVSGFGGVVRVFEHLEGLNRDFVAPIINKVVVFGSTEVEVEFLSEWMKKLNIPVFDVVKI